MKKNVSIPFFIMGILFAVCLILANLLEAKLIQLGPFVLTAGTLSWQVGPVAATAGLLVFPISYIINDSIVEVWGYRRACLIIWTGFAMNFFVVAVTQLAVQLPAPPYWENREAFDSLYGLAVRIVTGSFCAFLVGSFLNAYVMSRMKVASEGRRFPLRAIVSTVAGETADSLIFFPIAFGGLVPLASLVEIMIVQIALKSLYEILILPVTARLVRWLKRREGIDTFDRAISFNPFKLMAD